jgi:hypothetical protein
MTLTPEMGSVVTPGENEVPAITSSVTGTATVDLLETADWVRYDSVNPDGVLPLAVPTFTVARVV